MSARRRPQAEGHCLTAATKRSGIPLQVDHAPAGEVLSKSGTRRGRAAHNGSTVAPSDRAISMMSTKFNRQLRGVQRRFVITPIAIADQRVAPSGDRLRRAIRSFDDAEYDMTTVNLCKR